MKWIGNTTTTQTLTINAGFSDLMAWGYNIMRASCSGLGKKQRLEISYWRVKRFDDQRGMGNGIHEHELLD